MHAARLPDRRSSPSPREPEPCLGVVCQSPPNGCYKAQGQCIGGACQYLPNDGAACSDGDACTTSDACSEGVCRGTTTVCNEPPPDQCVTASTRRVWNPQGTCVPTTGQCQYTAHDYSCQFGCNGDDCQGDPCQVLNCDDGNPCTTDSCTPGVGCAHALRDGAACTTTSGDCPQGTCVGTTCMPKAGVVCQAEYDADLCMEVEVPGLCTASGECVVSNVPPEYTCPGCNGICIKCYVLQFCIPLF